VCADGTDGKQARRTNTCGPLGELFDHGLDSWAALLMPVGLYSAFGRGDQTVTPIRYLYVIMGVMFTFVCSHWEKYNTGVLFLPWAYDVSQLVGTGYSACAVIFELIVRVHLIMHRTTCNVQIVDDVEVTIGNYFPEVGNTAQCQRRRVLVG